MQSVTLFIRISGPISEKIVITLWENIIAYWEEFEQSKAAEGKCGLFQI